MVSMNLKVLAIELLAKIRVLACSCSQNFCNCSHARIFVKLPCRVAYALFASWKQNLALETMFPVWETGKHWRNMRAPCMNVSGKIFPRCVDAY